MKNWKQKVCLLLVVAVMFISTQLVFATESTDTSSGSTSSESDSSSSGKSTKDIITEKESQISDAKKQSEALKSGITDVQAILDSLETEKGDLETYVTQLDASLDDVQTKIDDLNAKIEAKEAEIKVTTKALAEAKETEKEQYESMKSRIKFMYEKGDTFFLEMLFSSKSFGEFLNKNEYIDKLSEYDSKMLEEYKATRDEIAACEEELKDEQDALKTAKEDVESEEAALSTLIDAKEAQIDSFETDIGTKEEQIKAYQDELASQTATIKELEATVAAEKAKLAEENGETTSYDGGMFAWPAPSYTRISSDYGNRIHPTLGVEIFHNGVDMAAPGGSPILAAYDGTVVSASYSGTMGNYIMLDHGDNLYTIYMHASALYVSAGETVAKGQQIAAVGTTGRSTGNHLHFSVRLNGSYVSPWNYLSN